MTTNPIDEIKRIRHQLGADVNFDVNRIFKDLREQKASSNHTYVDSDNKSLNQIVDQRDKCVDSQTAPPSNR